MEKHFSGDTVTQRIRSRLHWIHREAADTIGGALDLELLEADEEAGEYRLLAHTTSWMRNVIGSLHGGSCAAMVDQAMGCVANCLFADALHAPTSQLQLNLHRPMLAGEDFEVVVNVVNVSRSMIHTAARVYGAGATHKLCASSTAVFFRGKQEVAT